MILTPDLPMFPQPWCCAGNGDRQGRTSPRAMAEVSRGRVERRECRSASGAAWRLETWCLPPAHRGGQDPDPERTAHGGDPPAQAEAAQPLDLRVFVGRAGAARDQDRPAGPPPPVIVVGRERRPVPPPPAPPLPPR